MYNTKDPLENANISREIINYHNNMDSEEKDKKRKKSNIMKIFNLNK